MKYEETGEVVNLTTDRYTTDVMLGLDAKDSRGYRLCTHLPLIPEVQRTERLIIGDRIRFGWEPERSADEAEPDGALGLALQALQSEAVASVRRAWMWTAGFAILTNLAWVAAWLVWR